MTIKLGMVMDPLSTINELDDESSIAILHEAQKRQWEIFYIEQKNLFLRDEKVFALSQNIQLIKKEKTQYELSETKIIPIEKLDVILMRVDPPFNISYIYTTYFLEQAERAGVLVINKPQSLRDANEKFFTAWFPQCCPKTLVAYKKDILKEFISKHQKVIIKSLDGLAGDSIFYLTPKDKNLDIILEKSTSHETIPIMAQEFIPDIQNGDQRIFLIDGKPIPYALIRKPKNNHFRVSNTLRWNEFARPLNEREYWLCEQIGKTLQNKGLFFVGIDVIGDYITEINVTSPGCIHNIDRLCNINISSEICEMIEKKIR